MTMAILMGLLEFGDKAMHVVMHAYDSEGQDEKKIKIF